MRSLCDMDTIQIEITNACTRSCSNCTRFCGHQKPYFMSFEDFQVAVQSMKGYPKMTGIMGGEPLLHPQFEEFCNYIVSFIPKSQLGLWSSFPPGYEKYREVICKTFDHIFLNDHSREDVYHCPILVGAEEIYQDRREMFYIIDHCWIQNFWSAAINPKGAFFCEIAASMSILFKMDYSWPVEPGWWWRTPKDFKEQIEAYCPRCGCAIPLNRRSSLDERDDISPRNLERLRDHSLKIQKEKYVISDLKLIPQQKLQQMGAYKDLDWRKGIAQRYGIFLMLNDKGFLTPLLTGSKESFKPRAKSLYQEISEEVKEWEKKRASEAEV